MIPTPGRTKRHYGIRAVNYHSGETLVLVRRCIRRKEIAELLEALLEKHPHETTIYLAWDNAFTRQDDEIENVVGRVAGRFLLLYLPTYSPWLVLIEMLWRHFRREVTHCELLKALNRKSLIEASLNFFQEYNERPKRVLSIIRVNPQLS